MVKCKKGFTIIELIVVMAIIGILVLLAAPRFLGHTKKAQLTRIINDVKVMENVIEEDLALNDTKNFNSFPSNTKDLGILITSKNLFHIKGLATSLDDGGKLAKENNQILGMGGPEITGNTLEISKNYKIVPDEFVAKTRTKLQGTFYVNINGKVYYEHNKNLEVNDKPTEPGEPTPPENKVDKTELIKNINVADKLNKIDYKDFSGIELSLRKARTFCVFLPIPT